MYLVFPVFTAKPISIQAFNNTSAFLSIVMASPIKFRLNNNNAYLLYGTTALEELRLPPNKGFFI